MRMTIGFIGAGKMAEAIMAALVGGGVAPAAAIRASDPDGARQAHLAASLGIAASPGNRAVAEACETLFLCVKPQQLDAVLREIAPDVGPRHLVISIAAGKRIAQIESLLPLARVIRVMPNVACLAAAGMNVFAAGTRATREDRETASRLLGACGLALELPETLFDAVTAVSGSGPAFFARFLEHLVAAGVAEGLAPGDALRLAAQTMLGTARLLLELDMPPAELIRRVTSPGGTTAAGLAVFDESDFGAVIGRAIAAAAARGRELGRAAS